jgi:hypothetical protein
MKLGGHLLASPLLLALYPIWHSEAGVAVAIISSLAIDLDHLQLIIQERAFSHAKIIKLSRELYGKYRRRPNHAYKNILYPCHTVEFNILLLGVSYWFHPLIFVEIGFIYHIIGDLIHHQKNEMPIPRLFVFVHYLKANKVQKISS